MTGPKDVVRLNLDISAQLNAKLDGLAESIGGSKSDVLRKAIALMELAVDAKNNAQKLVVVDSSNKIVKEIVGI